MSQNKFYWIDYFIVGHSVSWSDTEECLGNGVKLFIKYLDKHVHNASADCYVQAKSTNEMNWPFSTNFNGIPRL